MIAVIISEKNQGIPSSGIQFCFWGALVIYASIKLRTLILISRDQVCMYVYAYMYVYNMYVCMYVYNVCMYVYKRIHTDVL